MYINRQKYLDKLISQKDKDIVKVITGIRRCGKSVLLFLTLDKAGESNSKRLVDFTYYFFTFHLKSLQFLSKPNLKCINQRRAQITCARLRF